MVFILSVVFSYGVELINLSYNFFLTWIVSFSLFFGLMEIGILFVKKSVKNKNGNFLFFCFSFLALCYILQSFLVFFLDYTVYRENKIQLFFISVILIIGLFQAVYYWIIKNGKQRTQLLKEKQAYLQHSFNALKSQNVIEFLQEALINTVELIKKNPNLAVLQIEKLTSILRHLLQTRDERFVKLGAELNNVNKYCELAEIQLNKKVDLCVNITDDFNETKIPPLVFQMVLDNQFKNFAISNEKELNIEVYVENRKFVVVKTPFLSSAQNNSKNQQFINNLKQRYQLYNNASGVSELSTVNYYFVKFPLVIG